MAQRKPTGFVIYEGPSVLDGAPIVAIAVTASDNRKTGNMVQTYILRRDVHPSEALRTGDDASIRGDCKHRPALGGASRMITVRFITSGAYDAAARAHRCPDWSTAEVPEDQLHHWERFAQITDRVAAYAFEHAPTTSH